MVEWSIIHSKNLNNKLFHYFQVEIGMTKKLVPTCISLISPNVDKKNIHIN